MSEEYAKRVLTYLQQEMPVHKNEITINGEQIMFSVPSDIEFQPYYEAVHQNVRTCISRIRDRAQDLGFSVRAQYQARDFKIWKFDA